MIAELGYEAASVADGEEALTQFSDARQLGRDFRAVILDLTVPGRMGGLEAAAQIRKVDPAVPIFVASGYASGAVMADPASHGLAGSIRKPFTLGELGEVLSRLETMAPDTEPA
jgi:CheY-like chemotaxis protein